ncbi:MAG: biotin--[acetyl-CoA-carboxylase] ligase [Verrucomicrobiota bacterium]
MSIDRAIFEALLEAGGGHVSGERLARRAGVSRAAIKKHVDHLTAVGYPIAAAPRQGYRLPDGQLPDVWCAEEISARLARTPRARPVDWRPVIFRETASTNDLALREGQAGAAEGFVALAESQSSGRGRAARAWSSPPGTGLWCSLLLRPEGPPATVTRLTLVAAVALAEALEAVTPGLKVGIKWPNDLLVGGRKLGGILTEAQVEPGGVQFAVVGFGLNVDRQREDFPPGLRGQATSLRIEAGRAPRRAELLVAALLQMERYYRMPFAAVRELWKARCVTLGQRVEIRSNAENADSPVEAAGEAVDIDERGALLLRGEDGTLRTIEAGDAVSALAP